MTDKLKHSTDEANSVEEDFYRAVETAKANRALRKAQSLPPNLVPIEMNAVKGLPKEDMEKIVTVAPKIPLQNPVAEVTQALPADQLQRQVLHKEEMHEMCLKPELETGLENIDTRNELAQQVDDTIPLPSGLIQILHDAKEEFRKSTSGEGISPKSLDDEEVKARFEKAPTVKLPREEFGANVD